MPLIYLIFVVWIGLICYNIFMSIWVCFDHTSWKPDASPSMQATITNVSHKNVKYSKNNKKIQTTVEFSDMYPKNWTPFV